jgi:hypothetical protein
VFAVSVSCGQESIARAVHANAVAWAGQGEYAGELLRIIALNVTGEPVRHLPLHRML